MVHFTLSLALGLALAGAAAALDFSGTGQLRAEYRNITTGSVVIDDLGCLTDGMQWTRDEALCGVFTGVRAAGGSNAVTLSTDLGACGMAGVYFGCGQGTQSEFMAVAGILNGTDSLWIGEYSVYASQGSNPPSPSQAPETIGPWQDTESGDFIWLGWRAS